MHVSMKVSKVEREYYLNVTVQESVGVTFKRIGFLKFSMHISIYLYLFL